MATSRSVKGIGDMGGGGAPHPKTNRKKEKK